MKVEYQTRDSDGKYQKEQDILNIYVQEDGTLGYLIIEKTDGTTKRYLLDEI